MPDSLYKLAQGLSETPIKAAREAHNALGEKPESRSTGRHMEILEVIAHGSTLAAAVVAIYGITAWRREHRGQREIDLAEETLALFYQAEDALAAVRHPASFAHETDEVVRTEKESDIEFRARKNAFIVWKRFADHDELFAKLHAIRYRFMAVFGKQATQPFDQLNAITWEVKGSAMKLARLWAQDQFATNESMLAHRDQVQKLEMVFWDYGDDDDPLKPKVAACIEAIESSCRGAIEHGVNFKGSMKP